MDLKQLLKPSLVKIIIVIVVMLTIHFSNIWMNGMTMDYYSFGYPLSISEGGGECIPPNCQTGFQINYMSLIINIIIWYGISSLVVEFVNRIRK